MVFGGCNNHITKDRKVFVNIDSSFSSKLKLGNGKYVGMKDIESIGVTTK